MDEGSAVIFGNELTIDDIVWMGDQPTLGERAEQAGVSTSLPRADLHPAIAAAGAGCDLLMEKPLPMNLDDARAIVDAVDAAGVRAMVAFENHWNPPFISAKAAVEAGELGDMIHCVSQLDDRIDVPTKMPKTMPSQGLPPPWSISPITPKGIPEISTSQ